MFKIEAFRTMIIYLAYVEIRKQYENDSVKGICRAVEKCYDKNLISNDARIQVCAHLRYNKPTPTLHWEFYNHKSFDGFVYWWDTSFSTPSGSIDEDSSRQQRLMFLDKMMSITEPNRKLLRFYKLLVRINNFRLWH